MVVDRQVTCPNTRDYQHVKLEQMDTIPPPKAIVVQMCPVGWFRYCPQELIRAGCLAHQCKLSSSPRPSFAQRLFKRPDKCTPELKEAYEFVLRNYRAGDHVLIFDEWFDRESERNLRSNRHNIIWQLANALDTGSSPHTPASDPVNPKIPIKCIFFDCWDFAQLDWSGVDRLMSEFPSRVENFLFLRDHKPAINHYVVQRGSLGQITRKESWYSRDGGLSRWS